MIQNTRCCLRQHSPLHEAAKPRRAADEPLRGVDPLQEVTGKALDDGLHVGGTAPDELHHRSAALLPSCQGPGLRVSTLLIMESKVTPSIQQFAEDPLIA